MNFAFVQCAPFLAAGSAAQASRLRPRRRDEMPAHVASRRRASPHRPRMTAFGSLSPSPSPSPSPLKPVVPILMGSASDMGYCEKIANALTSLGVASELRVASAHKVPARLLDVIARYQADARPKVYIGVAGRSNALSGVLDCAVSAPVISCPPPSDAFAGADIFSSLRMPSGVAPAVVLEPATAALFAAKILALHDPAVRARVVALQRANRDRLYVDDAAAVTRTYAPAIAAARATDAIMVSTDAATVFGPRVVDSGDVPCARGKVRDQYPFSAASADDNPLKLVALVTTDRQSAFDRVLAAIPFKGAVLNLTSAWWFSQTQHIIPNHVVAVPHPYVTIAKYCKPFPVEFVVRGYITGSTATSLWKNYNSGVRTYCGVTFPDGLVKNQKLEANVLTPTTKAEAGDEPIAPVDVVGRNLMTQEEWDVCATAAMKLFEFGQQVAAQHGLILVDTKYEFGRADDDGSIRLIDEVHTPDSSRFWLATSYEKRMAAGEEPENIDKEFLRLWFRDNCDPYDKTKELPQAPPHLVDELSRRYIMLYELITGEPFDIAAVAAGAGTIADAMAPFVDKMAAPASR